MDRVKILINNDQLTLCTAGLIWLNGYIISLLRNLYFQVLEDKERKTNSQREQLRREQRFLQRRLESLLDGQYRVRQERSISECSTSTNSTTSSNSESGKSSSPFIFSRIWRYSFPASCFPLSQTGSSLARTNLSPFARCTLGLSRHFYYK